MGALARLACILLLLGVLPIAAPAPALTCAEAEQALSKQSPDASAQSTRTDVEAALAHLDNFRQATFNSSAPTSGNLGPYEGVSFDAARARNAQEPRLRELFFRSANDSFFGGRWST
jgi:hypothetical protein